MRSIRAQTVLGDNHFEVGEISAKLCDESLSSIAFAVIFLADILFDKRLVHERNDFALVGVDEGRPQQVMRIGDGAVSVVCFQTRLAVNLLGVKVAATTE